MLLYKKNDLNFYLTFKSAVINYYNNDSIFVVDQIVLVYFNMLSENVLLYM